ncbi:hypothetical protein LWI29_026119 [Acer saccharum]|uniref:RRM domain-containing protein n=1 Tax=Acer saccharum TaxID=4024 RepID=A0AA39RIC0_ACESA|nr:hypothetical protein LWI29_026119 [Acer saccharum]
MGETGFVRFPGNLDPTAQEFRPRNPENNPTQFTVFRPPPQIYYPYAVPPPPPPLPLTPLYPSNDVQVLPFGDVGCSGGGGYSAYPPHPAYVSTSTAHLPLPPPSAAATRTLVLSSVAGDISESIVRRDLEVFGEVRGVQMERVLDGIVTVHFYDLRHAEKALKEIREQHMQHQNRLRNYYCALMVQNSGCDVESLSLSSSAAPLPPLARGLVAGRAVWAQFMIPASNAVPEGNNQGTIVVFNLDSGVSSSSLKDVFQAFGAVKELRETPLKKHQRFVEFYDIRDAAKALKEMNGKEIYGKPVVIEFSRPGGFSKKFFNAHHPTTNTHHHFINSDYNAPPSPPPPPSLTSNNYISPSSNFSRSLLYQQTQTQQQPPFKKKPHSTSSSSNKGNPNGHTATSIEAQVASSLSLADVPVHGNPRRSFKKSQNNQSAVAVACATNNKQQQVKNKTRLWKGRQAKKFDARFLINGDAMVDSNCKDSRTTVMIKNIPNKYSQKLLLNMLDNHCIHCNEQIIDGNDQPLSSYDFVYLPIDFNNKCNVGYGFVNMTSPEATLRLYKAFHLQNWEVFNSRKICEVTYARVQGLEALKEHFKNSKFPGEMDHYLPVVFSPPRDGRHHLTEPLPIVGLAQNSHPNDLVLHDHDHDDELDGADTVDNSNDSDYADPTNGGDLVGGGDDDEDYDDDEDRYSGSSSSVVVSQT